MEKDGEWGRRRDVEGGASGGAWGKEGKSTMRALGKHYRDEHQSQCRTPYSDIFGTHTNASASVISVSHELDSILKQLTL